MFSAIILGLEDKKKRLGRWGVISNLGTLPLRHL